MSKYPESGYFSVIFSFKITGNDMDGFYTALDDMTKAAHRVDGFLGADGVIVTDGVSMFISYWQSREAIAKFRDMEEHKFVRAKSKKEWLSAYEVQIGEVLHSYGRASRAGGN